MKKILSIAWYPLFPSWAMVLKCSKKSIKAIYMFAFERSRYGLSENGIAYYAMTYCFTIWSRRTLLNFSWVSIHFLIWIDNISETVIPTHRNHITFWKSVMITFWRIYVNYFNRLRFLAEVSTKLQAIHFGR